MLLLAALMPAHADTGDTADTGEGGDTAPYVDTAADAEKVFVQDVGCGSGAVMLPTVGLLAALVRPRR